MKRKSNIKICVNLIGLVKPLSGYMILAVLMGIIGYLCAIFITILGAYGILDILNFKTLFSLPFIVISVCILALLRGVLHYGEQACNHFIAFKLLAFIRNKVFISLRRLCPAKLEGRDKGNLIAVITSDIELLEVFYAHTISPILIALFMTVIMCVFIGWIHFILAFVALISYIVIGVAVPVFISKLSDKSGAQFQEKSGQLSSFILDSMRGLSEVLQFGVGNKRVIALRKKTAELLMEEEKMKLREGIGSAISNTFILMFNLIMLLTATILYQKGVIVFDGVLISIVALMSSYGPFIVLANLGAGLQRTFGAGDRVIEILEEQPSCEDATNKKVCKFQGAEAERVSFSYEDEIILSDFSLKINTNSIVGISGKSGSGKSTLLKLFMRFWDNNTGTIRISNRKIDEINTVDLRDMESFVTQETHLFHDSIRNNLCIAKLDATDEEIELACKKASVHDFIMTFPQGYDTVVGELGDTLSGGERQRIGLARAFLHNAPFMLFDEPTSNLDSLNEATILRSISEEQDGKTIVLVSHRKSTMRIANKIYNVEHGRRC